MLPHWLVALCACSAIVLGAQAPAAPQFLSGTVPGLPQSALGGGEVLVELTIARDGRVSRATPLRTTPPFTEMVVEAVSDWRFAPLGAMEPDARVLVAAVYRPPVLLGPTLGAIPRDDAVPSPEVPFPTAIVMPPFPPMAASGGVVLLEAEVDDTGTVTQARVVRSQPPFDDLAADTARQWKFRPAAPRPQIETTHVFIIFGFPLPIVSPPGKKP